MANHITLWSIMPAITCANCGTGLDYGMKFCRRCGTPLDASEASTQSFDESPRRESFTQPTNSPATSPSFVPPSYMPPAQPSPATNALEQTGQKKTVWILAGVALISLVAVIVLVVMLLNRSAGDASQADRGDGSIVVAPPPPPPPPLQGGRGGGMPSAPSAPTAPTAPDISDSLMYPGAQETMRFGEAGSKVIGLSTSDPLDKVVEYYKTKAGLKNQVLMAGELVMLAGQDVTITITREGDKTNILITSGAIPQPPAR